MEVLTTLLLFIGLLIMWIAQRKGKKQADLEKKRVHTESPVIRVESSYTNKTYEEEEDLRDRHLEGTLKESTEVIIKKNTSMDKINRLSNLKKAIVWSEILDKPVSERYNVF